MTTRLRRALIAMAIAGSALPCSALPSSAEVEAALAAGNFRDARAMLVEIVEAKPESSKAWMMLARAEAALGRGDEAVRALARAQALEQGASGSSKQKAQASERTDSGREAPLPAPSQVEQAIASGDWPAAKAMLEKVVQARPNNAKAWYYLAQTEERLGDLEKAASALAIAQAVDPSLKFASPGSFEQMRRRLPVPYADQPGRGQAVDRAAGLPSTPQAPAREQASGLSERASEEPARTKPEASVEEPSGHGWAYALLALGAACAGAFAWRSRADRIRRERESEASRKALLARANKVLERAAELSRTARFEGQESSAFAARAASLSARSADTLERLRQGASGFSLQREMLGAEALEAEAEALESQAVRKAWDERAEPGRSESGRGPHEPILESSRPGPAEAPFWLGARAEPSSPASRSISSSSPQASASYGAPAAPQTVIMENGSGSGMLAAMLAAAAFSESRHAHASRSEDSGHGGGFGSGYPAPAPSSFDYGGGSSWASTPDPSPSFDPGPSSSSWDDSPSDPPASSDGGGGEW